MLAFLGHPGNILEHPEDILGHLEGDLKRCKDRCYPESLNL